MKNAKGLLLAFGQVNLVHKDEVQLLPRIFIFDLFKISEILLRPSIRNRLALLYLSYTRWANNFFLSTPFFRSGKVFFEEVVRILLAHLVFDYICSFSVIFSPTLSIKSLNLIDESL